MFESFEKNLEGFETRRLHDFPFRTLKQKEEEKYYFEVDSTLGGGFSRCKLSL